MTAVLDIATAPRAASKTWTRRTTTWAEVCRWAHEPRDGAKDGRGFVLGKLTAPRRTKDTVESRCALALDADHLSPAARDELLARLRALSCAVVVYSTYSHTAEAPRLRVLVLATRAVSPDEYRVVVRWLMELLGNENFDHTCDQPERFMYMPTKSATGEYFAEVMEGDPYDVDEALFLADLVILASPVPSEGRVAETNGSTTLAPRSLPEGVLRSAVAWTLHQLDALANLSDGDRLAWPGLADGVGWDMGCFLAAQRLVEAANSGPEYSLSKARADFLAHAPNANGTYDPLHKWASAVTTTGERALPYEGPESAFPAVAEVPVERAGGWTPVDLRGYLDGTHAPPEATLMVRSDGVGLLYPGMTHSIHGESESGKSMIVQAEVAKLLVAGRPVLYLDYEADPGSVVERLRLMGVTDEQFALLAYLQPEVDHGQSEETRHAFRLLLAQPFDLAVIDGVTEALAQAPAKLRSTGGLGGNDDITIWHDRLPRVIARATGAAVVLVDHVAKNPDAGRFAIGGQAKMATISGAAYLVRPRTPLGRGLVGEVQMYVAKDRHGYVRSKAGEFAKDRLQHVATAIVDGRDGRLRVELRAPARAPTEDDRVTQMMERISEFLSTLPDDNPGATLNTVKNPENVAGNNELKVVALRRLVALGAVTQTRKGQSTLHRNARPYVAGFEQEASS